MKIKLKRMFRSGLCRATAATAAIALGVVAATLCGCVTPSALKEVLLPRAGRAIYGKVAIVYAKDYQIKAGGIEKLRAYDIRKYERIYRALVDRNLFAPTDVFVPEEVSRKQLLRVHTADYLDSLRDPRVVSACLGVSEAGLLPAEVLESRVLRPFRLATGGTLLAAREALKSEIGINIGGGYHHAKPSSGEGFCIYADIPIAIRQLQNEGIIRTALIIDLDVHQGNGSIASFRNDPDVFTFSMHQGDIYPVPKSSGDWDIELPRGMGDEAYLKLLAQSLPEIFARSGKPDIVFYVAGCDTLKGESQAHLAMTHVGIVERDRMVVNACRNREVPIVMTLGGGYSRDAWKAHYLSIRQIISSLRE